MAPKNQQEASARASAMNQAAAVDPATSRENNPERYPRDERGFTDTAGAAKYLDGIFSEASLRKARHFGRGPSFIKAGAAVRYSYAELDLWLARQARTSTRDSEAA